MENLINSTGKMSIDHNMTVDQEALDSLLKSMQQNGISSLSASDLIEKLASLKLNKGENSASTPPVKTPPKPAASGPFSSPDFSFKSPSNVFTPFNGDTNKRNNKSKNTSEAHNQNNAETGPFSGHFGKSNSQPALGSFYGMARDSIPGNLEETPRPSSSDSSVFSTTGLNSLNMAAPTAATGAAAGLQFHLGGPAANKNDTAKKPSGRAHAAKASRANPPTTSQSFQFQAPGGSAFPSAVPNSSSWFWGTADTAPSSTAPAQPSITTTSGVSTRSSSVAAHGTSVSGFPVPAVSTTASAPQPFTFSIGSDGATKANPTPSSKTNTASSVPTTTVPTATATTTDSTAYTEDGPSFTVYTLGDHDILHSLHENSSSDSEDEPVMPEYTTQSAQPQGKKIDPEGVRMGRSLFHADDGAAGAEESDASEMSLDEGNSSPYKPNTTSFTTTTNSMPPTSTSGISTSTSSRPAAAEASKPDFGFLFNGQSASASMAQFEKDGLRGTFDFSIGSSKKTTKPNASSAAGSATPSVARTAAPEFSSTFDRVTQAFVGLSAAATPGAVSAGGVPPPSQPAGAAGTTASTPFSSTTFTATRTTPAVPPLNMPSAAPGQSSTDGVSGLAASFSGFNIGKAESSVRGGTGSAKSRNSAKKASPAGKKRNGVKPTASGADSSSNNSAAPDAPPSWWTEAQSRNNTARGMHSYIALLFYIYVLMIFLYYVYFLQAVCQMWGSLRCPGTCCPTLARDSRTTAIPTAAGRMISCMRMRMRRQRRSSIHKSERN